MKFRSKFYHGFTYRDCTVLFQKLRRQEICSFSIEMFNIKIFKTLKMFKYNMKFIRAACWIILISNRDKNTTLMMFLFCNYCWSLLWCNYWRSLMLWNSTSWSRLKLTVQIQLALYLCDPFLINNRNMAGNSVEK